MRKAFSYVRFSTLEQGKGSSYKRQIELAKKWAEKNDFEFVDTIGELKLLDTKSGFYGDHIHKGALGAFYRLIEDGQIDPGSALIVESMDRLSREGAWEFLPQFQKIINAGIIIVTLIGGERQYQKGKIEDIDFIVTILAASRAHEESYTKSYRIWDNHNKKRAAVKTTEARIQHLVGDGMVPPWIKIVKKVKRGPWPTELDNDRAKLINRMADEYIDGRGETLIAKGLNADKIPGWGRAKADAEGNRRPTSWTKHTVWKILRNRQLIGEHQLYFFPHEDVPGEEKHKITSRRIIDREPDGPPIADYFPAAMTEEKFNRLRIEIVKRSGQTGRQGGISSLFPSIARCGYCGSGMMFVNKGRTAKGHRKYLVCSTHQGGKTCSGTHLPYPPFQTAFLKWCREVDIPSLVGREDYRERLIELEKKLAEVNDAFAQTAKKIKSLELQAKFLKNEEAASRNAKLTDYEHNYLASLGARQAKIKKEIVALESSDRTTKDHLEALAVLYTKMEDAIEGERNIYRLKMRHAIRKAVNKIMVFPDGLHDLTVEWTTKGVELVEYVPQAAAELNLLQLLENADSKKLDQAKFEATVDSSNYRRLNTGRANAAVLVVLKNGSQRLFYWDNENRAFRERLAFEKDTERIIDGGSTIELNPDNMSKADLLNEIALTKNLQ